jgi:ornithine decarboxylase
VEIFYAMKANPHMEIIKHFAHLGAGFDVASPTEIKWALKAGVKTKKLIFANTIKSIEGLRFARSKKVNLMTFDNETELDKIAKYYPGAKLVLRLKVANVGSMVELSLKFGAELEDALYLLKKAQKLGLKTIGISFHVGSQCTILDNYLKALESAALIFDEAAKKGIKLTLLDIGGGFPIKHLEREEIVPFDYIAKRINKELKRLFFDSVQVIAEPGRFLVGNSGTLVTQVIGKTYRDDKQYYYLNDGVYQDFSGVIFDHCQYEYKTFRKGKKCISTLAGPTCDSLDTITYSVELPKLKLGDIVYVKNIGAYSCASAVPAFNGIAPAKVVLY